MDKNWRVGFVAGLLKRLFTSLGKGLRAFWNDKREEWGTGCSWVDLVLENVVWEWGTGSLVAQRAGPSVLMMGTG